jgi:hypothetical protein
VMELPWTIEARHGVVLARPRAGRPCGKSRNCGAVMCEVRRIGPMERIDGLRVFPAPRLERKEIQFPSGEKMGPGSPLGSRVRRCERPSATFTPKTQRDARFC